MLVQIKKITRFLLAVVVMVFLMPIQSHLQLQARVRPRTETDKRAEIVVDVETGRILHDYKSEHLRHPASLTKLMTLYLMRILMNLVSLCYKTIRIY